MTLRKHNLQQSRRGPCSWRLSSTLIWVASATLLPCHVLTADQAVWVGGVSMDWSDAGNWLIDGRPALAAPGAGFRPFWGVTIDDSPQDVTVNQDAHPIQIDALSVNDGDTLKLTNQLTLLTRSPDEGGGVIANAGKITIEGNSNLFVLGDEPPPAGGILTLSGGGEIELKAAAASTAGISGTGGFPRIFINEDNTIHGVGFIGFNSLVLVNRNFILADQNGKVLAIDPGGGSAHFPPEFTNDDGAFLSAQNGGILELGAGRYRNHTGGTIDAKDNSRIDLGFGAHVSGGTLRTLGSGLVQVPSDARLSGTTQNPINLNADIDALDGSALTLAGTISNLGQITTTANTSFTRIAIDGEVDLSGSGSIRLASANPNPTLNPARLTNLNPDATLNIGGGQEILGFGAIEGVFTINNGGTIAADRDQQVLSIRPTGGHKANNTGTLEARDGGRLVLFSSWDLESDTLGTIQASDNSLVLLNGMRLSGQQLRTPDNPTAAPNGGEVDVSKGAVSTRGVSTVFALPEGGVFNEGLLEVANNSTLILRGAMAPEGEDAPALTNNGTILLNAEANGFATLHVVQGDVRLTGGGRVVMSDQSVSNAFTQSVVETRTNTLLNVDNSITGSGDLGGTRLAFVNEMDGVVRADGTRPLAISPALTPPDGKEFGAENRGLMEAVDGSELAVRGGAFWHRGTAGQVIRVDGTGSLVRFEDGKVTMGEQGSTATTSVSARDGGRVRFAHSEVEVFTNSIGQSFSVSNGSALEFHASSVELVPPQSGVPHPHISGNGSGTRIDLSGGTEINSGIFGTLSGGAVRILDDATLTGVRVTGDLIGLDGSVTKVQESLDAARFYLNGVLFPTRIELRPSDSGSNIVRLGSDSILENTIFLAGSGTNQIVGANDSVTARLAHIDFRGGGRISGMRIETESDASPMFIAEGMIPVFNSPGTRIPINGELTINTTNAGDVFTNQGSLIARRGGTLTIEDQFLVNIKSDQVQGAGNGLIWVDAASRFAAGNLTNEAEIRVVAGGAADLTNRFRQQVAEAVTVIEQGATLTADEADWSDGQVVIDGIVTVRNGNGAVTLGENVLLKGGGTINGNLANSGIFRPGQSPGIFTLDGDFEQRTGGTLEIELAGQLAGTEHDVLRVDGNAQLDGALGLVVSSPYLPALGDELNIVEARDVSGRFSNVDDVDIPSGLGLAVRYHDDFPGMLAPRVSVRVSMIGDIDFDNDVDTGDLTTSISNFTGGGNAGSQWTTGDFDGDGDTDTGDLTAAIIAFTGAHAGQTLRGLDVGVDAETDGVPDLVYDPATGNVTIDADGADLVSFSLQSGPFKAADFSDLPPGLTDNIASQIGWTSGNLVTGLTGVADLGAILPVGLDALQIEAALSTASHGLALSGGGGGGRFDIVIPEPASLTLIGLGLLALLRRARAV